MPPANTPQSPSARTPSRPQTPSHNRPLTPLSYLSSPAPDLAATLHATSQAADEADEANVSFLRRSVDSLERAGSTHQVRRSHVDAQRDPRRGGTYAGESGGAGAGASGETAEDLSRRQRLQRVLARLNRFHEPGMAASSNSNAAAYTNRTPSPNRQQTIYDWAPSYDDAENADTNELDSVLNELRRQQPDTHPDILRVLGQSQVEGGRAQAQQQPRHQDVGMAEAVGVERRNRVRERERRSTTRETEWQSLRNRAVMQRVRQEGGGSPSATERMLRYVMDRERSGMSEEEERARGSGWFRPTPSSARAEEGQRSSSTRDHWALPPPTNELRERDRQERVDAFRRGYLAGDNVPPRLPRIGTPPVPANAYPATTNASSTFLESALKYLSELRDCNRYEEALSTAIDHGLATKEFFADKHDDFIMDLDAVPPLPFTSWLQPGTIFAGHQHATGCGPGVTQQRDVSARSERERARVEQINPNYHTHNSNSHNSNGETSGGIGRWHDRPPAGSTRVASAPFDPSRPWLSHTPPSAPPHLSFTASSTAASKGQGGQQHDHWPVRVIIHAVDPEKMTLQGTMEAYDVPQHTPHHLPTSNNGDGNAEPAKAGKKSAPITTYLEGHIVDFRTHSFLTPGSSTTPSNSQSETTRGPRQGPHMTSSGNQTPYTTLPQSISFPSASARTDAENWLKLPPFNTLSTIKTPQNQPHHIQPSQSQTPEDQLARLLLSTSHLTHLTQNYIFMRWKEKCFIHTPSSTCSASLAERQSDQDRGHGLTISGFYYVSLERETGRCEGVYFDPGSTPCQFLELYGGRGGGWGAWDMR